METYIILTRQNCLVTTVCFLGLYNKVLRLSEWVVIRQILSKKRLLHKAIFIHSSPFIVERVLFLFYKLVRLSAVILNRISINYYKPNGTLLIMKGSKYLTRIKPKHSLPYWKIYRRFFSRFRVYGSLGTPSK